MSGSKRGLQLYNVCLGELLRHEVMSGSKRGLQLYKLMEMGELVPVEVVLDLLSEVGNLILFSKFDKKTGNNKRLTSLY